MRKGPRPLLPAPAQPHCDAGAFCPKAIIRRACVALALVLLLPLLLVHLFTFIRRHVAPLPVVQVFPNLLLLVFFWGVNF